MNYHQRAMLRVTGVILLALVLLLNVYTMPRSQEIRLLDRACTLEVDIGSDIPVGQVLQEVLDFKAECNKVHMLRLGMDYSWIFMGAGSALLFIGIWTGLGAKDKRKFWGY